MILFFIYCLLTTKIIKFHKKFNHIHIAMSLTNNYTYPIMVSITSILINSKNTTFINFHLLIGNDIKQDNLNKIKSLKKIKENTYFYFYNV